MGFTPPETFPSYRSFKLYVGMFDWFLFDIDLKIKNNPIIRAIKASMPKIAKSVGLHFEFWF